jgi:hypothetical protein
MSEMGLLEFSALYIRSFALPFALSNTLLSNLYCSYRV